MGREQMRAVGRWFASYLLQGDGASLLQGDGDTIALAWGSSRVQRTVDSGACFLEGLKGNLQHGSRRSGGSTMAPTRPPTTGSKRGTAASSGKLRRAGERRRRRRRQGLRIASPRELRPHTSVVYEARPGNAASRRNDGPGQAAAVDVLLPLHDRGGAILAHHRHRRREGKLRSALSSEEIEGVEEMARWVWQRRFHTSGWGAVIGGTLLADLLRDLRLGLVGGRRK